MSRIRGSLTKSSHLGEDLVSRFRPHERLRRFVGDREVLANGRFQGTDTAMRPAFDLFLTEEREPAFDEVEPRRAGGREVEIKPRMSSKPAPHARGLVGAVVVENQMHGEVGRYLRVDGLEKFEELLTPMASMTFADDLAGRDIERREQGGRAMPPVSYVRRSGEPKVIGRTGAVRSSAWI